jgi:hypothetical protein
MRHNFVGDLAMYSGSGIASESVDQIVNLAILAPGCYCNSTCKAVTCCTFEPCCFPATIINV